MGAGGDVLVPIILDGENAWEYYFQNGRPFLTRTVPAHRRSARHGCADRQRGAQDRPAAGSGSHLSRARGSTRTSTYGSARRRTTRRGNICCARGRHLMNWLPERRLRAGRLAFEELLIAEGSDWCWWYGPEHHSDNRVEFESCIASIWPTYIAILSFTPPEELSRPILMMDAREVHDRPNNADSCGDRRRGDIVLRVDGRRPLLCAIRGQDRCTATDRRCAISITARDRDNLFLRIDFEAAPELTAVELRTAEGNNVALFGNPACRVCAEESIRDAHSVDACLAMANGQALSFQVALTNGSGQWR